MAARWAALLGHGGLDAAARPEAAAAVVATAWLVARAGLHENDNNGEANDDNGKGNSDKGHERWAVTRAAAFTALARYDPAVLVESPTEDETQPGRACQISLATS